MCVFILEENLNNTLQCLLHFPLTYSIGHVCLNSLNSRSAVSTNIATLTFTYILSEYFQSTYNVTGIILSMENLAVHKTDTKGPVFIKLSS